MKHDYEYYSRIAFDPRQLQIIKDGLDLGLDVDWYANTAFDYLQMEQIFLALKAGVSDPDALNMFCDPEIPYKSMEQLRIQTCKQLGIYEKAAEEVKKKRIIRIGITFVVLVIIVTVSSVAFINRKTIGYYFENIHLELKEEKILRFLGESQTITRKKVQELLGVSQASAGRVLKAMVERGQIVPLGGSRTTRYELAKRSGE